jgi:hypothetical protein
VLEDPYPEVREHATVALSKCGELAIEPLLGALRRTDAVVQRQARLGVNLGRSRGERGGEAEKGGVEISAIQRGQAADDARYGRR